MFDSFTGQGWLNLTNSVFLNYLTSSPLEQFMFLNLFTGCPFKHGPVVGVIFTLVIFILVSIMYRKYSIINYEASKDKIILLNKDNSSILHTYNFSNIESYLLSIDLLSNFNNLKCKSKKINFHSTLVQYYIKLTYNFVLNICRDNIIINYNIYVPFIYFIFNIILLGNCIGLLPYSLTITSTFIITLFISLTAFIGLNIIGLLLHGLSFFKMFLPQGVPLYIAPMLVVIEVFSYFIRVLSITIRLFANILAGHSLLKILITAIWFSLFNFLLWLPINAFVWFSIVPIFILECVIAVLQTYVFTLLIAIYLNDVFNLH